MCANRLKKYFLQHLCLRVEVLREELRL